MQNQVGGDKKGRTRIQRPQAGVERTGGWLQEQRKKKKGNEGSAQKKMLKKERILTREGGVKIR